MIYLIEESTNLLNWAASQTMVAGDTNYGFTVYPTEAMKFSRASVADERLQFPDWNDYVELFAYFRASSTVDATYHQELYGDGNLLTLKVIRLIGSVATHITIRHEK